MVKPKYPKLITLKLIGCNINNIEALSFLDSPLLSKLIMSNNQITLAKSFRKSNFQLDWLHLDDNYINNLEPFYFLETA